MIWSWRSAGCMSTGYCTVAYKEYALDLWTSRTTILLEV